MEPFIGEIKIFGFGFPPRGWAACDGQTLPIAQNQALFSILGTTYGGDGVTNFKLPDLRGRCPIHASGPRPLGSAGGEELHVLTEAELPQHTHHVIASSNAADRPNPDGNFWSAPSGKNLFAPTPNATMHPQAFQPAGNLGHENRPPYQVLNICIALVGIFPSRT